MAEPIYSLESLRKLSVSERIQLVEDLWDTIADEAPDDAFPISEEVGTELDRRLAEAEADATGGLEWSDVRRAIEARQLRPGP